MFHRLRALSAACLAAAGIGFGAPGAVAAPVWIKQLGTTAYDDIAAITFDTAGNVYVSGITGGPLGGTHRGQDDAWIMKFDATGKLAWKRQPGTSGSDSAWAMAAGPAGSIYVGGDTNGALPGPNKGNFDPWIAKLDTNGNYVWRRQPGTTADDSLFSIASDANGNVYAVGDSWGPLGGPNKGNADPWIVKYDANGVLLWRRQPGSPAYDTAVAVAVSPDGGSIYVAGWTNGSVGGPYKGGADAWILKYDSAGNLLWKRQPATTGEDFAFAIGTDAAGNVYVTGDTNGSLAGPKLGDFDGWLAKLDPLGTFLWRRQFGSALEDSSLALSTDTAGNVFVGGWTYGGIGGPNQGSTDAWVARFNAAGAQTWAAETGTSEDDAAYALGADGFGNVYIGGSTWGALIGTTKGDSDGFLSKYTP